MTTTKCTVEEKGVRCSTTLEVTEPMSPQFKFICKNHPRSVQVRANGRQYDPAKDEKDKDLHFQAHQFDKDLRRSRKPIGTEHIHNQGADTLTSGEIPNPEDWK
jgi:hypothetical protein